MNPDKLVEVYPGEWRPECFGHTGYGDGYSYAARCDVRVCKSGGDCYRKLRDEIENRDPEAAAEYEARRKVLREEGLDSMNIVRTLARQGFPPTTQDAVLENTRQGQLASGHWWTCFDVDCDTLVRKPETYCYQHKPQEDDDGARDGGTDGSTRGGTPEPAEQS